MKLEKWALFAEIIGGLAIVVSLLFVGAQIQQSRIAQVQAGTQAVVSEYNATTRILATDPELACIYALGMQNFSALSGSQRLRFSAYHNSIFNAAQQMYSLYLQGAIDAETWAGMEQALSEVASLPGWQQWFSSRELWYGEGFRHYVQGKIKSQDESDAVIYDDPRCSDFLSH